MLETQGNMKGLHSRCFLLTGMFGSNDGLCEALGRNKEPRDGYWTGVVQERLEIWHIFKANCILRFPQIYGDERTHTPPANNELCVMFL
jgi:hypothetical protein